MGEPSRDQRKRCKRWNEAYHVHYLTFSCFRRQAFFSGSLAPGWFLESLDQAREGHGFHLWAFVVMPEHVHLVIAPGETYDISRILWQIKKPLSERVPRHVRANHRAFLRHMTRRRPSGRVSHHFWQPGGGYDRNLWTLERIHEKINYIHANPVRRGLVQRGEDWPWSSFRAWTEGGDEPLRLDKDSLPPLES